MLQLPIISSTGLSCNSKPSLLYSCTDSCSCICGLLSQHLVILVTHQLQFALQADNVLVIKEVSPPVYDIVHCVLYYIGGYVYAATVHSGSTSDELLLGYSC